MDLTSPEGTPAEPAEKTKSPVDATRPPQGTRPPVAGPAPRFVHGIEMEQKDLNKLKSGVWLNDTVISVYLSWLQQDRNSSSEVWFCLPWSYTTIKNRGRANALKTQAFQKGIETLVFVCNVNQNHWCICAVDVKNGRCYYFDSNHSDGTMKEIDTNVSWFLAQDGKTLLTYEALLNECGLECSKDGRKLVAFDKESNQQYVVSRKDEWTKLQRKHTNLRRYAKPTALDRAIVVSQEWVGANAEAAAAASGGKNSEGGGFPEHFEFAECTHENGVHCCGGIVVPQQQDHYNCGVFVLSMSRDILERGILGGFTRNKDTINQFRSEVRNRIKAEWEEASREKSS